MTEYERGFRHGWNAAVGVLEGPYAEPRHIREREPIHSPLVPATTEKRNKPKNPKRVKAMKMAQKKARLKSGKFRKGWGKSRLMKEYHRILKRL